MKNTAPGEAQRGGHMERGRPKTRAVTLEEWRVPVGAVVVTPTVVQQTIRHWLQGMNKSPVAVAKALGIGVGALHEWTENSRTIPRGKAARFCEVARNAKALPDATAREVEKVELDARMWNKAEPREAAEAETKPDKPREVEPAPELYEPTIKDWPRAIRLFLRLKRETTSQTRLERLTGIYQPTFSRWCAEGCSGVYPPTAAKLEAACKKHREWKKERKKEAAQAAGTAKAARTEYESDKPSPLSILQEDAIMQNTTKTAESANRNDLEAAADAAEIVRLKNENAALKQMVNEQTAEELINLKIIREFARRSLMKKGEQE